MEAALWVLAEVMDKQVPVVWIWTVAVFGGLVGFLIGKKSPLPSLMFLGLIGLISYLHITDIREPEVARAIETEAGSTYFLNSYLAIVIAVGLTIAGLALGVWRRTSETPSPSDRRR